MTKRFALAGLVVTVIATPLAAQWPRIDTTKVNFVDTIPVGRLPTGGCSWHDVQHRLRPGKPGTTTIPGRGNEKTCTVIATNYTTGAPTGWPVVESFAYVEDHKPKLGKNVVVNFADTFTVARTPDGSCDWSKTPVRTGKPGSSSYLAEALTTKCWGVVYNVTYAPQDMTGMKTSTGIMLPPHVWEGPDTLKGRGREARDIINAATAVLPAGSHISQLMIEDDTVAAVTVGDPRLGSGLVLHKRGTEWVPASVKPPIPR